MKIKRFLTVFFLSLMVTLSCTLSQINNKLRVSPKSGPQSDQNGERRWNAAYLRQDANWSYSVSYPAAGGSDRSDTELGQKFTHGTPFRRAMEEGLLDPKRTIQIGIRGAQNSEESWQGSEDAGICLIYMEEFTSIGIEATLDEVRHVVGQDPTYIPFDIDCLDPAFAPGTGTPEIGGLTTIQAQAIIRGLSGLRLVGGDVVGVSPPFGPSGNTALVGATMLYEIGCVLSDAITRAKNLRKNA